ncbi:uncharacterized protein LOC125944433 [Dermacentor silvarum]|uniref:uncharacterized protein LOC125944433 n=1 Tax=Dermacentor silvarum TaxID=543639 RepID=UPI002101CD1D|nr:uncharacterized protein LOC125944433 [Dermacentor silvarum]
MSRRSLTRDLLRSEVISTAPGSLQGDLLILARNPLRRLSVRDLKRVRKFLSKRRAKCLRHLTVAAENVRHVEWRQRAAPRHYCLLCYYAVAAVVSASVAVAVCLIAVSAAGNSLTTQVGDWKCGTRQMRDFPGATMQNIFSMNECLYVCTRGNETWVGHHGVRCKFNEESGICIEGRSYCMYTERQQSNVTGADDERRDVTTKTTVETSGSSGTTRVLRRRRPRRRKGGAAVETKAVP